MASDRLAARPALHGTISGGIWAERRRINREVSIPDGWSRLGEAGNLRNLQLAAGLVSGTYVNDIPFMDSDLYKWLEATAWALADPELADEVGSALREHLAEARSILERAQAEDGYLDSYFQVKHPGERFRQLAWGHELYCAGHLIQAAVALRRTTGERWLMSIATRFADLISARFGLAPDQIDGVCGHPEIESALVELYRETDERRYLDLAQFFVDRRGHDTLGGEGFGSYYFQDRVPLQEASSVEGHAVRQLYLLAGAADLHLETGEVALREACERLWAEMVATKTYLTGGIGAHHRDEGFGDPYELPSERSYCETCAAIASIMFSWRMLVTTGEAKYADLIERTLYNGFLAGTSLDGQRYIYANPLHVREGHGWREDDADYRRFAWFHCACCPPNAMRLLASLEYYVVLGRARSVIVHQYIPGSYTVGLDEEEATVSIDTGYPWSGQVAVTIDDTPDSNWELSLRIPEWALEWSLTVNGAPFPVAAEGGWVTLGRAWRPGDTVVLSLALAPRLTAPGPRMDAVRGAVALECGPLVYCVESADNDGVDLDQVAISLMEALQTEPADARLAGARAIRLEAVSGRAAQDNWWPYRPVGSRSDPPAVPVTLTAIPYFAWGNREQGAMRVWLPRLGR